MELVSTLKELWRRRVLVSIGVIVAFLLALLAVFQVRRVFPPVLKSRQTTVWVANSQVLVDARRSAIGNLNQGLDPLVPRAGVYANLMTSPELVASIALASHLPASQISVTGPIGTNGQRPHHGASSTSPTAPRYSLQLDTDETQPLIRITAQAPTSHAAAALAIGAGTGLTSYVTRLENTQQVSDRHRVDLRQLGQPIPSAVASGLAPILLIPIYLVLLAAWCGLVLFVSRFIAAWRHSPVPELPPDPWTETNPRAYDDDLSRYPPEPQPTPTGLYTGPGQLWTPGSTQNPTNPTSTDPPNPTQPSSPPHPGTWTPNPAQATPTATQPTGSNGYLTQPSPDRPSIAEWPPSSAPLEPRPT
jgi:hypothetical protein